MADRLEEQMYREPPLPPKWQWLCIVVIIVGYVLLWFLWR
jgi:hypothetical protein